MQLQHVDNKFMCVVDFWFDNIIVGFITEFVVDTKKSYNAAEQDFSKGPRGSYLR